MFGKYVFVLISMEGFIYSSCFRGPGISSHFWRTSFSIKNLLVLNPQIIKEASNTRKKMGVWGEKRKELNNNDGSERSMRARGQRADRNRAGSCNRRGWPGQACGHLPKEATVLQL